MTHVTGTCQGCGQPNVTSDHEIRGEYGHTVPIGCAACRGTGRTPEYACASCDGSGVVAESCGSIKAEVSTS